MDDISSMNIIVSDACQINDLNAHRNSQRSRDTVSDACQINDLNAISAEDIVMNSVSDACQINDLNAFNSVTQIELLFQMPVRSMT